MRTVLRPHRKLARARNSYNQRLLMVDNFNCPTGLPDGFYWNGTDTYSTIDLGANGGFETAGAGGADVFASWTETASDGVIAQTTTAGEFRSGAAALKLTSGPTVDTRVQQNVTVIPGLSYQLGFWTRTVETFGEDQIAGYGSFEDAVEFQGWLRGKSGTEDTFIDASVFHGGAKSVRWQSGTYAAYIMKWLPITLGKTYELRFWFKGNGTANQRVTYGFGTNFAASVSWNQGPTGADTDWVEVTFRYTYEVDGRNYIWLINEIANSTFYIDDVTVKEVITDPGRYAIWDNTNSAWVVELAETGLTGDTYQQGTVDVTAPALCTQLTTFLYSPATDGAIACFDDVTFYPTQGLISVSGGNLVFSGGRATPGWADPSDVSRAPHFWARQAGLTIEWQVTPGATNTKSGLGLTGGVLNGAEAHNITFNNNTLVYAVTPTYGVAIPLSYSAATSYWARIVLKATGAYYYVSTDSRVTWKLIWIDSTVTTTPLYAFIESYNAALTASKVEVRQGSVKGAVLSASPGAPALVAGAEGVVNGTFGSDTAWDKGVGWTIAANVATSDGSQAGLSNLYNSGGGVTTVGRWYQMTCDVSGRSAGWIRIFLDGIVGSDLYSADGSYTLIARSTQLDKAYVQANADFVGNVDNVSRKPLPFDQTGVLEYIGDAGVKLGIAKANITVAAGYHAGFVICANSATAPVYSVMAYYDRTAGKAYLLKQANNVWTEMVASTVAYAAGAELRLVCVDDKWGLYYNGALQGAIQTIDVSANYGTHVHSFQTGASDTVASLTVDA